MELVPVLPGGESGDRQRAQHDEANEQRSAMAHPADADNIGTARAEVKETISAPTRLDVRVQFHEPRADNDAARPAAQGLFGPFLRATHLAPASRANRL